MIFTFIFIYFKVSNRLQWFDWIRYSVTEYLFPNGWYNGDKSYEPGFTADTEASKVLAMARIRQLRVKSSKLRVQIMYRTYFLRWLVLNCFILRNIFSHFIRGRISIFSNVAFTKKVVSRKQGILDTA